MLIGKAKRSRTNVSRRKDPTPSVGGRHERSLCLFDPICRHRAVFRLADLLTAEVLIADRAAWSALIAAVPATLTKVRLALVLRAVLAVLLGVSVTVEGGRPMLEGAADSLPLSARFGSP